MRGPLIDCSSIYQIGGQPGHRAEELVFSSKSIIAKYIAKGKPIIIQSYDLAKKMTKKIFKMPFGLVSDLENVTIHTIRDGVKFPGFWVKFVTELTVFCRIFNLLSKLSIFWGKSSGKCREYYF